MEGIWRAEATATESKGKRPGRQWYETPTKWNWRERAEAWDGHERARFDAEFEERKKASKLQRLHLLESFRTKLQAALEEVKPESAEWKDVTAGIKTLSEQLRAEYDDEPIRKHELRAGATARDLLLGRLAQDDAEGETSPGA